MRTKTTDLLLRTGLTILVLGILALVVAQTKNQWKWGLIWGRPDGEHILLGLPVTLGVSVAAMAISLVVGIAAGLGRLSRWLVPNHLSTMYVEFVRGTPLLVQIMIAAYCVTQVVPLGPKVMVGILALAGFTGAYVAEIVRAGIESVPRGQVEAARSLGMTHGQAMLRIIAPQALKNALPPLAGQFISLIKDSSLLMVIGVLELTKRSDEVMSANYADFEVLLPLAGLYLVLTFPLSQFTQWLEKKLGGDSRGHRI